MGIYDRDYERNGGYGQQPGIRLDGPRTLTTNLVLVTFGVYLLQIFTQPGQPAAAGDSGWFSNYFSLHADVLQKPWLLFELLTYGFLHDPGDIKHIIFNMLGLWFFGRAVEQRYGRQEFLAFYLIAIVFAGIVWLISQLIMAGAPLSIIRMLGASGGLSAVLILFALNYPKQMVYIWGVLPLPAWAFAIFFVGSDVMGALNRSGNVAYTAHLGGALFGFLYFQNRWRVSTWLPSRFSLPKPKSKADLRIHQPEEVESETDQRVDAILKKIQEQGQESLTWRERRTLEKASQEYQRKRR
jgi:membrane associated rhomboid family serine protease